MAFDRTLGGFDPDTRYPRAVLAALDGDSATASARPSKSISKRRQVPRAGLSIFCKSALPAPGRASAISGWRLPWRTRPPRACRLAAPARPHRPRRRAGSNHRAQRPPPIAAGARQGDQVASQVAAIDRRDVLGIERREGRPCRTSCRNGRGIAASRPMVARVASSRSTASALADPAKVARARHGQQVEAEIGRRGALAPRPARGVSWKLSGGSMLEAAETKVSKNRQVRRAIRRRFLASGCRQRTTRRQGAWVSWPTRPRRGKRSRRRRRPRRRAMFHGPRSRTAATLAAPITTAPAMRR